MPTLTKFQILGIHLSGVMGGIYIAQAIASTAGWFWPAARVPAFIVLALLSTVSEVGMTVRELRKGRLSTGIIILDFMPFLFLGGALSIFLGAVAARWFGSDWGGYIVFVGVYYCILCVIAGVKYRVDERNLREDLEHPCAADPEEDAREHSRYMHPYI